MVFHRVPAWGQVILRKRHFDLLRSPRELHESLLNCVFRGWRRFLDGTARRVEFEFLDDDGKSRKLQRRSEETDGNLFWIRDAKDHF